MIAHLHLKMCGHGSWLESMNSYTRESAAFVSRVQREFRLLLSAVISLRRIPLPVRGSDIALRTCECGAGAGGAGRG